MRCYNCNKKFDYEKYYGICPKCGCFNRQETAEEQHEAVHDRFGDSSDEDCHRSHRTFSAHPGEERDGSFTYQEDGYTYTAFEGETAKKKGVGFFVFCILFFVLSVFLLIGTIIYTTVNPMVSVFVTEPENGSGLEIVKHEAGASFIFQEKMTLQVLECREVADSSIFPTMEEGKKLVAVHVQGESDGQYEDYNGLYGIYLETEGHYREPISSYYFEPYAQILGVYPALDDSSFKGEAYCDGWYGFLVDADADTAVLWLDEYDCTDWDGGNLIRTHRIELPIENLTEDEAAELEQAADEAEAEGLLQEEIFIDGTEVEGQSSEEISVDENGNLSVAVPGPEDFEAQEGGAGDEI